MAYFYQYAPGSFETDILAPFLTTLGGAGADYSVTGRDASYATLTSNVDSRYQIHLYGDSLDFDGDWNVIGGLSANTVAFEFDGMLIAEISNFSADPAALYEGLNGGIAADYEGGSPSFDSLTAYLTVELLYGSQYYSAYEPAEFTIPLWSQFNDGVQGSYGDDVFTSWQDTSGASYMLAGGADTLDLNGDWHPSIWLGYEDYSADFVTAWAGRAPNSVYEISAGDVIMLEFTPGDGPSDLWWQYSGHSLTEYSGSTELYMSFYEYENTEFELYSYWNESWIWLEYGSDVEEIATWYDADADALYIEAIGLPEYRGGLTITQQTDGDLIWLARDVLDQISGATSSAVTATGATISGTSSFGAVEIILTGDVLSGLAHTMTFNVAGATWFSFTGDLRTEDIQAFSDGGDVTSAWYAFLSHYAVTFDMAGVGYGHFDGIASPYGVSVIGGAGQNIVDVEEIYGANVESIELGGDDGEVDMVGGSVDAFDGAYVSGFGTGDMLTIDYGGYGATLDYYERSGDYWWFEFYDVDYNYIYVGLTIDLAPNAGPLLMSNDGDFVTFTSIETGPATIYQFTDGDPFDDGIGPMMEQFGYWGWWTVSGDDYTSWNSSGTDLGDLSVTAWLDPLSGAVTGIDFVIDGEIIQIWEGTFQLSMIESMIYSGSAEPGGDALEAYELTLDASDPAVSTLTLQDAWLPSGITVYGSAGDDQIDVAADAYNLADQPAVADIVFAGAGDDYIDADGGDFIDPGSNNGDDWITYFNGDIVIDLAGSGGDSSNWYGIYQNSQNNNGSYVNSGDDFYVPVRGAITAMISDDLGTLDYVDFINGGTSTVEILNAGGAALGLYGSEQDDYIALDMSAESRVEFTAEGGNDILIGGMEFTSLRMRDSDTRFYVTGYDATGASGFALDALGSRVTFSGVDRLRGGQYQNDVFYGGAGDDVFAGEGGGDIYVGNGGADTVRYDRGVISSVFVDLSQGIASVQNDDDRNDTPDIDHLYGIETIYGSNGDDLIVGSDGDDTLRGQKGDDIIDGGLGADWMSGGAGADTILMGDVEIPLVALATSGDFSFSMPDGATDLVYSTVAEYDGDTILQFGAEDQFFVLDSWLDYGDFSWDGATLSIDGNGDGLADSHVSISGDGIEDMALSVTQHDSGTLVTFTEANPIGEVYQVSVSDWWTSIDFINTYVDPVVFALAPGYNEADTVATRLRNISSTGAEIRLQEPMRYLGEFDDQYHLDETVTLLVLEKGLHTLSDGTVLNVGAVETNKLYVKGFEEIAFDTSFAETPAIFSQVQTFTGADWVISRHNETGTDGFSLTLQEEQYDNVNHTPEWVGWLAIETGAGDWSGIDFQAGHSGKYVNGNFNYVPFLEDFEEAPNVVATIASYQGTDPATARMTSVTESGFYAMAQEEQSADIEMQHGLEIIDWLAIGGSGTLYAQPDPYLGGGGASAVSGEAAEGLPAETVFVSGTVSVNGNAQVVEFGDGFDNPVVIAMMNSFNGRSMAMAAVSEVGETSFTLNIAEPESDDGVHAWESVSWIVVEEGTWTLEDGTVLSAGVQGVSSFGGSVALSGFEAGPAVLAQSQAGGFTRAQVSALSADGFDIDLAAEEGLSASTAPVGWLAVETGAAVDGAGEMLLQAGSTSAGSGFRGVDFSDAFDFAPEVFASMSSWDDADPSGARLRNVDASGFDVRVDEDFSADDERMHAVEEISWLALADDAEGLGWALV